MSTIQKSYLHFSSQKPVLLVNIRIFSDIMIKLKIFITFKIVLL